MYRSRSGQWSVHVAVLLCGLLFLQMVPDRGAQGMQVGTSTGPAAANARPILVELFTSEGCSSCPPADRLIENMDSSQPVPGAQLIVLSEHVDYWDHDGWKDPNSSAALTQRQDDYVHALGLQTPYTPQTIVDGTIEMRANNGQQVSQAFQKALADPKIAVRIGEVSFDATNPTILRARVEADGESNNHNADVYVAVALNRVESQVLHGENGGKHLTHVAVVQQLTKVGKLRKGKNFGETVQLKLKPGTDPKNIRIVAFVQESGPGKVLGAAMRRPAD
ncbi:MAG: DUF1223 domain-containing protein [Terriglobales bacterium]|jgi:hypothetical protein